MKGEKLSYFGRPMPAYKSVALTDEAYWKLEVWQRALSKRLGHKLTKSQTVDWLLDNAGVPDETE